ncbi:MAG: hypothetical protein N2V72_05350 [Methanophagales archaeon]|nr:hypothetical protein [Methanophagales archaeon]
MGIKIGTAFLDREFFNPPSILTLSSIGVDFIMAASSNKRIKRMLEEHKRKNGVTPVIFKYGLRVKNEFKIRTCSKKGVARVLFFVVQSIMHNFLNVQKSILSITAYELKSLIAEDIQKYLHDGKFLDMVPFREFYAKMASYNECRVIELRCQLAAS